MAMLGGSGVLELSSLHRQTDISRTRVTCKRQIRTRCSTHIIRRRHVKRSLYLAALLIAALSPAAARAQSLDAGVKLFEAKKYAEAKAFFSPYAEKNAEAAYYMG